MQASLDHITKEAEAIWSFHFLIDQPYTYVAGQFIEMTLPHASADERGEKRWFSLSSAPHESLISITTKQAYPGSSFKKALFDLSAGDTANISEPMGDFVLPKDASRPLLFIAGGIGITPFRSMFSELAFASQQRPIKFVYGVAAEDEIIFTEVLKAAGQHATIFVETPAAEWGGERGSLNASAIIGLDKPSSDALVYLSGPEPMVEVLRDELITQGVAEQQLVVDYFLNYTTI